MRFCYADPPYPGKASLYEEHPDYAGEVDHLSLVGRLVSGWPDGWALSTSASSLQAVLALCPPTVRVAAWFRGERLTAHLTPLSSWEPVIFHGGRELPSEGRRRRIDSIQYHSRPRLTDPDRVIGAKPAAFVWWLFDLLGCLPHDDFTDLFPGSGGVGRAWRIYSDHQETA